MFSLAVIVFSNTDRKRKRKKKADDIDLLAASKLNALIRIRSVQRAKVIFQVT